MSRKTTLLASYVLTSIAGPVAAQQSGAPAADIEEIVVTGTSIRGAAMIGAPLIEVTRETIDNRGYYNVEDALRSLPQMTTIGAMPGLNMGGQRQNGSLNYGKGSSVNLRGLGPDATLVLLNGRRIASSGTGTFYDVSQIPLIAVERVEIVTEGSSAIYGSDAVAGVVNIITPKNIRGFTVEAASTLADDYDAQRVSLATGYDWGSGGMTAAAEYRHTGLLLAAERDFFMRDQRAFGGPDLRAPFCAPGNVTAGGVTYALPPGNGVGLTPAQLSPGTSNRCDPVAHTTLVPSSEAWSGVLHAEQELGSGLSLFSDVLYSRRNSFATTNDQISSLSVPASNPYFIPFSPPVTSVTVQYNFFNDLGRQFNIARATSLTVVAGVDYDFASNWRASIFYGFSRGQDTSESMNDLNTYYINQALASNNPSTAFNPFGSGGTSSPALIDSFRGYSIRPTQFEQHQVQGVIDGSLGNPWGAGDVRMAIGGEWLDQDFAETNRRLSNTPSEVPGNGNSGARSDKALFAEISIPLVGPDMGVAYLRSATLSAAVRGDDYSDFGTTTNPRVGVDIEPIAGFHFHGSWGESFKAPNLSELSPTFSSNVANAADASSPTGATTILNTSRLDRPLSPQSAESWAAGVTYADPERTPLTVSATYFHIDYTDRIELLSPNTILANGSAYAHLINRNPTAAQIAEIQADPNLSAPFTIPPGGVGAIVYSGRRNIASLDVRGVDLSAGYWWQTGLGRLSISAAISRMLDYDSLSAAGLPTFAAVGLIGFPNEWRMNGDIALETDTFRVFTGLNLMGDYRNNSLTPVQRIPTYVTINAGLRLMLDNLFEGLSGDTSLQLSALNLFDREPPFVLGTSSGFDAYSADPIGRQVTLSLRTRF